MWQNLCVFLCVLTLCFSSAKSLAIEDEEPKLITGKILWLSAYQDEKLDLELKGFNYSTSNQYAIDFIASNKTQQIQQKLASQDYQYLVAVADKAWQLIEPLETKTPKIGVSVSAEVFKRTSFHNKKDHYLISKEPPSRRIFAMLKAMDLNRIQAASLFNKGQQQAKNDFIKQAKIFNVPFQAIDVKPKSSTIKLINSIDNCCRVLYLKQRDLNGSAVKLKSILFESYRRKIITITDDKKLLKHGAIYAIYSQPHQLGQQAANIALGLSSGANVEPLQEPHNFVIDSNHKMKNIIGGNLATLPNGTLMQKTKFAELTNTESRL
ncbi:MAG: hypothetical protein HWE16_12905 [Gammaproteobacteria bacterium]|nr:hypothetical protein [Gammaproteobacteria bacterium]